MICGVKRERKESDIEGRMENESESKKKRRRRRRKRKCDRERREGEYLGLRQRGGAERRVSEKRQRGE